MGVGLASGVGVSVGVRLLSGVGVSVDVAGGVAVSEGAIVGVDSTVGVSVADGRMRGVSDGVPKLARVSVAVDVGSAKVVWRRPTPILAAGRGKDGLG